MLETCGCGEFVNRTLGWQGLPDVFAEREEEVFSAVCGGGWDYDAAGRCGECVLAAKREEDEAGFYIGFAQAVGKVVSACRATPRVAGDVKVDSWVGGVCGRNGTSGWACAGFDVGGNTGVSEWPQGMWEWDFFLEYEGVETGVFREVVATSTVAAGVVETGVVQGGKKKSAAGRVRGGVGVVFAAVVVAAVAAVVV